jgi:hypothetical protein
VVNSYTLSSLHVDAGLSGSRSDNRPALQKALSAACQDKAALVVYNLSRLARSTAMAELRRQGRRVSRYIPYGFELAASRTTLVPSTREQKVLTQIRALRLRGLSLIATRLTDGKILRRTAISGRPR